MRLARSSCAVASSSQAAQGHPAKAGHDNRGRVRVKDMSNTRVQTHGLQFQGEIVLSALDISFIKSSQTHRPEINVPHAIANGLHTNMLTGEQVADVDPPGIPVDQAAVADAMRVDIARVDELGQALRIRPGRRSVEARRRALCQRLMRTLRIVVLAEQVEAPLLYRSVGCRGLGGRSLERAVHALVAPVLLRTTWLNTLGHDPQPNPPDRQARQPRRAGACERDSVVGAQALGQP